MRKSLLVLFALVALLASPASADEYDRPPGSIFAVLEIGASWATANTSTAACGLTGTGLATSRPA